MIRRLLIVLLFVSAPLFAQAQQAQTHSVTQTREATAHQAAPSGEEHGAEKEQTFLGFPAWIFKLVNLLLFFGLLAYFLGGPIRRALAERNAAIRTAADEAREHRAKADQVAGDIQKRLAQLESEVRQIAERAVIDGDRQKRELLAAAEAEATKILATAKADVDNRVKNARHELTEYAGTLASDRAAQLLREQITAQDQTKLFKESLQEVEEASS